MHVSFLSHPKWFRSGGLLIWVEVPGPLSQLYKRGGHESVDQNSAPP